MKPDENQLTLASEPKLRAPDMIKRRLTLFFVLGGIQSMLLAGAWFYTFRIVQDNFASVIEQQILDDNTKTATEFSKLISDRIKSPIKFGSPEWAQVQAMVESVKLPADGFVCLIDSNGKLLCHPDLKSNPSLKGFDMGKMTLDNEDGSSGKVRDMDKPARGRISMPLGGTHFVAIHPIEGLDAQLLVHQPERGLVRVSSMGTASITKVAALTLTLTSLLFMGSLYTVMRRYESRVEQINIGLEHEVERRYGQSLATRHGLIIGLAKLADCRDTDTGEHLDRISIYSALLAEEMSKTHSQTIDSEWIECIRLASTLHDIGKVGIPDRVLLKPGKLTPEERVEMEKHSAIGADALDTILQRLGDDNLLGMSHEIARWHHERWDGNGYPDGLAGESIPLSARIVAVADVYDALTSKRVYKPAMPHEKALSIILGDSGTHFDPAVCEAFSNIAGKYNVIRAVAHDRKLDRTDISQILDEAA